MTDREIAEKIGEKPTPHLCGNDRCVEYPSYSTDPAAALRVLAWMGAQEGISCWLCYTKIYNGGNIWSIEVRDSETDRYLFEGDAPTAPIAICSALKWFVSQKEGE